MSVVDDADPEHHTTFLSGAHDALNRMKRAYDRGTGCHLTAEMIDSLGTTIIGQLWEQSDPRGEG